MSQEFFAPIEVEDGYYEGRWSGYELRFDYKGQEVNCQTDLGIRGINVPATFRIVDGKLDQKSLKAKK